MRIKPSRNGEITLSLNDIGISCEFLTLQICLLTLLRKENSHENFRIYSKQAAKAHMILLKCAVLSEPDHAHTVEK